MFWGIVGILLAWGAVGAYTYLHRWVGFGAFADCGWLGLITFFRVALVVIVSTVIWVPIGATIGLNPRLARIAQPIVQILASFPANLLFPFLIIIFLAIHLPLNWGSILLMAVGAQWYILFNSIAGATAIPNDLREMSALFRLPRRQRWRQLILPAIFPAYVTGESRRREEPGTPPSSPRWWSGDHITCMPPGSAPISPKPPARAHPITSPRC